MSPGFPGVYQADEMNEWIWYILEDTSAVTASRGVPATYHQSYRPISRGEKWQKGMQHRPSLRWAEVGGQQWHI